MTKRPAGVQSPPNTIQHSAPVERTPKEGAIFTPFILAFWLSSAPRPCFAFSQHIRAAPRPCFNDFLSAVIAVK
uniref:Uncharacterized protein n=1 Tax=Ascaris lumbricoides TaxID=6252 RepID=A0A0M3IC04_ASCLU